tara:strand:- start:938 stop:1144 length:207 start_codon:yes stop_codon:yes gene_type:complete
MKPSQLKAMYGKHRRAEHGYVNSLGHGIKGDPLKSEGGYTNLNGVYPHIDNWRARSNAQPVVVTRHVS